MTLDQLKSVLDKQFGAPFLAQGHVRTAWIKHRDGSRALSIHIGRRDVTITEDGTVETTGTLMLDDSFETGRPTGIKGNQ